MLSAAPAHPVYARDFTGRLEATEDVVCPLQGED